MATETAASEVPADVTEHLTTEDRVGLLRAMLMMRGIEERAMTLYRQGKVPGSFYDGFGQEAVSAGATWAMAAEDRLCILHRDLAAHIIRGVEPWRIFAQYMGRADGITRGRDGNVHFGDRTKGCVGMISMLPDMMLIATGMAMAFKLRGEQRCAITWFGDGSTSRGDFHEAMNWAGVQKLPVIFVLENNQYAYSTPVDQQFAVNPIERAAAYGFPGVSADGNDPEAMFEVTRLARERALAGEGPTLIEAVTMRMHGHAAHDDMKYVPNEKVEEWRAKDPIDRQVKRLEALGVDTQAIRDEVKATIDAAVEKALKSPMPDPNTVTDGLFADEPSLLEDGNGPVVRLQGRCVMATMTYLQAISDAMREEMRADERVFLMGEDIGTFGGAFKVTDGFIDEFGAKRVMDTPLAESAIVGCAIGAAVEGLRPIAEMQFSDFVSLRLRPARERRRQDLLPDGPVGEHHRPAALRRRLLRRPVPLAEPRGVVHARAGAEDRRAEHRRGRQGPADRRRARPEPGAVHGAQAPVPAREGRGARAARTRRRSPRGSRARAPT